MSQIRFKRTEPKKPFRCFCPSNDSTSCSEQPSSFKTSWRWSMPAVMEATNFNKQQRGCKGRWLLESSIVFFISCSNGTTSKGIGKVQRSCGISIQFSLQNDMKTPPGKVSWPLATSKACGSPDHKRSFFGLQINLWSTLAQTLRPYFILSSSAESWNTKSFWSLNCWSGETLYIHLYIYIYIHIYIYIYRHIYIYIYIYGIGVKSGPHGAAASATC